MWLGCRQGNLGFNSWRGQGPLLFSRAFRLAPGPSVYQVPGAGPWSWPLSSIKCWGSEWHTSPVRICCHDTHRDNFTFTPSDIRNKRKAVPLQAWSGPEGSRKLRFPDFMTTAQDAGKVVSLTHWPPLPPGNTPGTHFC